MRTYITDIPGGTATTPITMTQNQSLSQCVLSFLSAAAGKIELSVSPTSQIGTAAPTEDVLARVNCSGTAGNVVVALDLSRCTKKAVKAFQVVYIHQTGAGNLGTVNLS